MKPLLILTTLLLAACTRKDDDTAALPADVQASLDRSYKVERQAREWLAEQELQAARDKIWLDAHYRQEAKEDARKAARELEKDRLLEARRNTESPAEKILREADEDRRMKRVIREAIRDR